MKKIALLLVLALLVTVFVGCGKTDGSGVSSDPIKIGVLLPTTGSFASLGEMAKVGCEIYESDTGNELAGRKIEIYYEDTASDTNTCIEKAQRLIEREGCTIIVGPLSGGEGMAIKEFAAGYPDVTFVVAGAASEDITMRGTYPNVFRTGYTGAQVTFNFGPLFTTSWASRRSLPAVSTMTSSTPRSQASQLHSFSPAVRSLTASGCPPMATTTVLF